MLKPTALAVALALLFAGAAAAQKPALDHDAYDVWRSIEEEQLSADGRWLAFRYALRVDQGELHVVSTDGAVDHGFPRAAGARFDAGSRFVAFMIRPAEDSVKALRRADTPASELPPDTLGILDLETGEVARVPRVRSFRMPEEDGRHIAFLFEPEDRQAETGPDSAAAGPEAAADSVSDAATDELPKGSPLLVRELRTGAEHRIDGVVDYAFSEDGDRLVASTSGRGALRPAGIASSGRLADGPVSARHGVVLVELESGEWRTLLSGAGRYTQLTLSRDGGQVAFLSNRDEHGADQPAYALYRWREGADSARALVGPATPGVPDGWWVSEHGIVRFSDDGDRLLFGTAPRPAPEPDPDAAPTPEDEVRLDVWHWRDPYIQPMQKLQAGQERTRSYLAVAHLDDGGRVVQLADPSLPRVELGPDGEADVGLAETSVPYRHLVGIEAPGPSDLWLVDADSGERRRILEAAPIGHASLLPDGDHVAWYDYAERAWFAADVDDGAIVRLTAGLPPLFDELDDHPMLPPAYGDAGWTDDGDLIVYDRFDLWALDPSGEDAPRSVTEGFGREEGLRLRLVDLEPDEPAIEDDAPMLLSAFDVDTRVAGFYRDRVEGDDRPERLLLEPKSFSTPRRARDADVLLWTREDVAEYPDLWVSDLDFRGARRLSDANPQQSDYNWATVELVEWRSADGLPLQGLLYKPEDFDPSKRYPMMVNFYERDSDNLYRHYPPLPHRSVIRPTFYASRGYIVFMPDIVYHPPYPGESAMRSVMPGVMKLAAEPWVDEDNVGLQGHSWGGYQIAYMITQTDFFEAAEAGAPVANMTSAYGGIRWGSGMSRIFQYERTQSRIGQSLWDARLRYIENSPLFFADQIETPLLIMHNDQDGAVPWTQGIELFMALRRLEKPVWMITYNDQPHWPITEPNKRDWNIRMQQFFDHWLKDAPAPVWMVEGIPATEKGENLGLDLVEGEVPQS